MEESSAASARLQSGPPGTPPKAGKGVCVCLCVFWIPVCPCVIKSLLTWSGVCSCFTERAAVRGLADRLWFPQRTNISRTSHPAGQPPPPHTHWLSTHPSIHWHTLSCCILPQQCVTHPRVGVSTSSLLIGRHPIDESAPLVCASTPVSCVNSILLNHSTSLSSALRVCVCVFSEDRV